MGMGTRRPLAGGPPVRYENLLALRMIVLGKLRIWLVAHDRRNLARLTSTHQVDPLSPDRPAWTLRPLHLSRIGDGAD